MDEGLLYHADAWKPENELVKTCIHITFHEVDSQICVHNIVADTNNHSLAKPPNHNHNLIGFIDCKYLPH